jgi:hypothetical protein
MTCSPITIALFAALLIHGTPSIGAEDHTGHDHAAHAHGKTEPVGSVEVSVYKIAVSAAGAVSAGKEWLVELRLNPTQPTPKAIRAWVGAENGRGSSKAKAEAEKDAKGEYSAHIDVPSPLPEGSKLWISIESDSGETTKGSLPIAKGGHDHQEGDGHKH